jgi:hypothetical protein
MDIAQWFLTAFRVMVAGLFALLPGLIFWLTVLGFYSLIRWIGQRHLPRARHSPIKPLDTPFTG